MNIARIIVDQKAGEEMGSSLDGRVPMKIALAPSRLPSAVRIADSQLFTTTDPTLTRLVTDRQIEAPDREHDDCRRPATRSRAFVFRLLEVGERSG